MEVVTTFVLITVFTFSIKEDMHEILSAVTDEQPCQRSCSGLKSRVEQSRNQPYGGGVPHSLTTLGNSVKHLTALIGLIVFTTEKPLLHVGMSSRSVNSLEFGTSFVWTQ